MDSKVTTKRNYRIPNELLAIIQRRAKKQGTTETAYVIKLFKRECLRKR